MAKENETTSNTPARDRLYQHGTQRRDFSFNHQVAEVFDDMLNRSIPFYHAVIEADSALIRQRIRPGGHVVDLGCSTGSTLLELSRLLADLDLRFTGIDNAAPMLDKARLKAKLYGKSDRLRFIQGDITTFSLTGVDVVLCNYTLQFIRPLLRPGIIQRIHDSLVPGGMFLCAEKVIDHDQLLNRLFIEIYYRFKRQQGYSEIEIAAKREALENVLIPFSIRENKTLFEEAGFAHVESFFQWFNFTAFVAIKHDAA